MTPFEPAIGPYIAGRSAADEFAPRRDGIVRLRRGAGFAGPALVAATAYMDPGNFAVNLQAGGGYRYQLLWVVLVANLVAMLFQGLSAKLGIVTGRNLAQLCREQFSRPVALGMWAVSELAAMATDLAELLGGAIGVSLLLHVGLMSGMLATGVATAVVLLLDRGGMHRLELLIGAGVATIGLCYLVELAIAPVDWRGAGAGLVSPRLPDGGAVAIAVGIIGATVMPHALFLHSSLTQSRGSIFDAPKALLRASRRSVIAALAVAGLVNIAIVVMAASVFGGATAGGIEGGITGGIEDAYRLLGPLLGGAAANAFLLSLILSGLASSVVGTLAGQVIMQGFTGLRIAVWARRLVTMLPAFGVVALGIDTTQGLVLSQIALSLALPVPMIALVLFTRRRDLMGSLANSRLTDAAAIGGTVLVLGLNAVLLAQLAI